MCSSVRPNQTAHFQEGAAKAPIFFFANPLYTLPGLRHHGVAHSWRKRVRIPCCPATVMPPVADEPDTPLNLSLRGMRQGAVPAPRDFPDEQLGQPIRRGLYHLRQQPEVRVWGV